MQECVSTVSGNRLVARYRRCVCVCVQECVSTVSGNRLVARYRRCVCVCVQECVSTVSGNSSEQQMFWQTFCLCTLFQPAVDKFKARL